MIRIVDLMVMGRGETQVGSSLNGMDLDEGFVGWGPTLSNLFIRWVRYLQPTPFVCQTDLTSLTCFVVVFFFFYIEFLWHVIDSGWFVQHLRKKKTMFLRKVVIFFTDRIVAISCISFIFGQVLWYFSSSNHLLNEGLGS